MLENCEIPLDEQAKWDFIQEVERYQRKLRHIEATAMEPSPDLFRIASQEHLERVTAIYAQAGSRRQQKTTSRPELWVSKGPAQ